MGVKVKILIVNKFLYPNGGSETYIFGIGRELTRLGHEVQFFGMEHDGNIVGNKVGSYTSGMNFHGSSFSKISYPFKIVYSKDARAKIRKVLDDFNPDIVHLNNINFQITPSVIDEIKQYNPTIRIVYTAHDYQWVCPNHQLRIPSTGELCTRCISGKFSGCEKFRCIHNSRAQSVLGAIEGGYYRRKKTYRKVDAIICPSSFMEKMLSENSELKGRTMVLRNFVPETSDSVIDNDVIAKLPDKYVLYFGRFDVEKGIDSLIEACKELPEVSFVFAGSGARKDEINKLENVYMPGFLNGSTMEQVIRRAEFTVYPSIWYENCPFSVMESQIYGTPVVASEIGGIPELVDSSTGVMFKAGDTDELTKTINELWNTPEKVDAMRKACPIWVEKSYLSVKDYCEKLLMIYRGESVADND